MNKLITELQRLYFLSEQKGHIVGAESQDAPLTDELLEHCFSGQARLALMPVNASDSVRCAVLQFTHSQYWPAVGALHQSIVEELGLPAPVIAVAARAGFQMWFSFEHPLPLADVQVFLDALCREYLSDLPAERVRRYPDAGAVELPPALDEAVERWSAFIDPTMGSMFVDEGGLDLPPNPDRQADLLAGLKSIGTADFRRAMEMLRHPDASLETTTAGSAPTGLVTLSSGGLSVGGGFDDPRRFLVAVMNDTQAAAAHRIEAAKALLPYFAKQD